MTAEALQPLLHKKEVFKMDNKEKREELAEVLETKVTNETLKEFEGNKGDD